MANAKSHDFVFLPLGGVGEIGMNLALYGYGNPKDRDWVIVDMGVSFGNESLPGVQLVLPDINFILENIDKIHGIIITHAHEDHYGAIVDLWPLLELPVYATAFTAGLLETKLASEKSDFSIDVRLLNAGEKVQIGPFEIEPINVNHSILEAVALLVKTPLGQIIHTGDWKFDNFPLLGQKTDKDRLKQIGEDGVLALVCDSTNSMVSGTTGSELLVYENTLACLSELEGRVFVAVFSSHVGRIYALCKAALEVGRKVLLLGRSIQRSVAVAKELGYFQALPEDLFVNEEQYNELKRDEVLVILTGSQGESKATLSKLARGELRAINVAKGDKVIYSARSIPGNEVAIHDIQNKLVDLGLEIVSHKKRVLHVSGHPSQDDLAEIYDLVRPDCLVPVHGEPMHLRAHKLFAESQNIKKVAEIRNGQILQFAPQLGRVVGEIEVGRIFKDGNLIGHAPQLGIIERRRLSYVGHLSVLVQMNKKGELAAEPQFIPVGLPTINDKGEDLIELAKKEMLGAIASIAKSYRKDLSLIETAARRAVRATIYQNWGKKPIVTVFVTLT